MERLLSIFPKEIRQYGSAVVYGILPSSKPDIESIALNRAIEGSRLFFDAKSGLYQLEQRVELVEVRFKGPYEALGIVKVDPFGFSRLYARPWDPDKMEFYASLGNLGYSMVGDYIGSFKRLP